MGWDIHFYGNHTLGEILEDEKFKIDFNEEENLAYLYVLDENGKECGVCLPDITKDNYKEEYPSYGRAPYGAGTLSLMWELYVKFGIVFADTCLEDYYYLADFCEDDKERSELFDHCCAEEMTWHFGDMLDKDSELWKTIERTQPLYERLLKEYKEDRGE